MLVAEEDYSLQQPDRISFHGTGVGWDALHARFHSRNHRERRNNGARSWGRPMPGRLQNIPLLSAIAATVTNFALAPAQCHKTRMDILAGS